MIEAASLPVVVVSILFVLVLAGASGRWLGLRKAGKETPDAMGQIGVVQGALLGLLALLLGFTFSMAVSRFDTRRQLVIDEANAIGTAYLRAQVLPQPLRGQSQQTFREYLAVRVRSSQASVADPSQTSLESQAAGLFARWWAHAMFAVEKDIHLEATTSYMESLNEMNDTRARRNAALENHVPESVLFLIVGIAALSVAYVGYGVGVCHRKHRLTLAALCLAIALVIGVIIDIDRPRHGLIQTSPKSLIELQKQISAP